MATINNRSRLFVSVARRDDLYREFPYSKLDNAETYLDELRHQGLKPKLGQYEDTIEIRIRQRGFPEFNHTASSLDEAEAIVRRVESERRSGLFIDYTSGHQVTFAELIRRYMVEEGPKHKGWQSVERYKCQALLEDAEGGLARRLDQIEREERTCGRATTKRGAMRQPLTNVEWILKPFARVQTTDVEDYVRDRLEVVMPATVDRELDLIAAICNVAINVWKIRVAENPMVGVRRPRYFNERNRRLKIGEECRLLEAAREEDRLRSIDLQLESLMIEARQTAAGIKNARDRKQYIREALEAHRPQAAASYLHVPLFEVFIQFQLMTAARRGETLGLTWSDIDLEAQTAFLAETKNGRARTLPLRADLVELLMDLPRSDNRVFPIRVDALKHAWTRITARAGVDDLHIHDLRHEAISRVAEVGAFSLVDLQAFSGHRDTRMLLRYSHLCATQLADRLDKAFGEQAGHNRQRTLTHRGRRRLKAGDMSIADIVRDSMPAVEQPS